MSEIGRRTELGFTLLELLVTLCIVGLLSAAGAVAMTSGEGRRLHRNALAVTELLGKARRGAQESGAPRRVDVLAGTISLAGAGLTVNQTGNIVFRLRAAGSSDIRADAIIYYPDGSSTGGVVEIDASGVVRKIEIDSLGRVDVRN